ncbi:MAG: response regulator transcription factor [Erysipelotrichaceae bacterium]|nr:response regulator transcription factor [Erysipelotrichaceae bacterium]
MGSRNKILVIEDEENISRMVSALLESNGYQVFQAKKCSEALMMSASYVPDLIVLDLGLPDADGLHFLKELRKDTVTPVIILSARSTEKDKVDALDAGANDYITKPFGAAEFLARVRSALRSVRGHLPGRKFELNGLSIDYDSRCVFVRNVQVHLTQTEYNIVVFLAQNTGKVLTYTQIIKEVWGYPDEGSIKKLQVNMANIRRKFGEKPGKSSYIVNELGVGYRMNG